MNSPGSALWDFSLWGAHFWNENLLPQCCFSAPPGHSGEKDTENLHIKQNSGIYYEQMQMKYIMFCLKDKSFKRQVSTLESTRWNILFVFFYR